MGQFFQKELRVKIYSNSLVRAISKVYIKYILPHTSVGLTSYISIVFSVLNILTHLTTMLPVGSLYDIKDLSQVAN